MGVISLEHYINRTNPSVIVMAHTAWSDLTRAEWDAACRTAIETAKARRNPQLEQSQPEHDPDE